MLDVILKRFESPDEVRTFEKGKFEIVHLGGMIGRATHLRVGNGRTMSQRGELGAIRNCIKPSDFEHRRRIDALPLSCRPALELASTQFWA